MKRKLALVLLIGLLVLICYFRTKRKVVDITAFKQYAVTYHPCREFLNSTNNEKFSKCYSFPAPNEDVIEILDRSVITPEFKKYVLLATLKLYSFQIQEYHQTFEIRDSPYLFRRFTNKNALTRALCEVTGKNFLERKLGPEFLSPEISYEYAKRDSFYYQDRNIKKQLKFIDSISNTLR